MAKRERGRPSKYKQQFEDEAFKMSLLGLTDEQLAGYFEIDLATLNRWKQNYPNFCESIKNGKEKADAKIAESLYKLANGYEHPEDVISVVSDGSGLGSSIVVTPTVKRYPPNERAIRFWLMNRHRDKWTEKQEVGFTNKEGNDIVPIVFNPAPGCKPLEETPPNE